MKKINNILTFIIIGLLLIIIFLLIYIVNAKKEPINNLNNNTNINDFTNNFEDEINEEILNTNEKFPIKNLTVDFLKAQTNNRITEINSVLNSATEDIYKVNLKIENINVNGIKHTIEVKNFEPNDYDCEEGIDKVVYLNGKRVFEPMAEGCYLISLDEIIIFKNQYIILKYQSEAGGWFSIFDSNGNEIKDNQGINILTVKSINKDSITITAREYLEEPKCRNNEYVVRIENGKVIYTLLKLGTSYECMF